MDQPTPRRSVELLRHGDAIIGLFQELRGRLTDANDCLRATWFRFRELNLAAMLKAISQHANRVGDEWEQIETKAGNSSEPDNTITCS